ncbi:MAG: MFS transporter, partial [Promethearchaeota archaeon]
TYLEHVLHLEYIYISIMVSISALFGLIFLLVFGIISDNTRSERFGRRRPYIFIGGTVAGICMIIYGFSTNYITCFILDAIIIGVFSNMFYAGQRPLIPDLIDIEHRGRANGIVSIISSVGMVLPIFLALYINEVYGENVGGSTIISQEGHIFILTIGGLSIIIVAIIALIFLRDVPVSNLPPKKRFFEDLRSSFQYEEILENKDFFKIIIGLTIFNMGFRVIAPFVFNYIFSLGLSTLSLIFAISIIIPVIFSINFLLGKMADKYGRKKLIMPSILISCIGFFMIPFLKPDSALSTFLLLIAIILVLITVMSLQVPLSAWQQDLLPENKRGQFLGIINIVYTISQIPGAILGGLVADAYGLEWIFAVAPIFFILSIPFFFLVKETLPEDIIKD